MTLQDAGIDASARSISTRQAAFIGVAAMVGAGIFSLLGAAGEVAGAAVWLSFLLAGAIAALQGYSFARLGARYPSAGGLLEYVNRAFGEGHVSTVVAWLVYMANGIVTAMVAISFGSYASEAFAGGDPAWIKGFAVALLVVMTGVNLAGSTVVARAQSLVVFVVIGILAAFAAATIANADPANLAPSTYPGIRDIVSSVARRTTCPSGPAPSANSTRMNCARSVTGAYMLPAGAIPSSNVGAGKVRPSSVHIAAFASRPRTAGSGVNAERPSPIGRSTASFTYAANGCPCVRSRMRPTTAMPAFEYLACVPGSYTRRVPFSERTVPSSDTFVVSK